MEVAQIVGLITTIVGTLGGWEAVKWFLNRKQNKRKATEETKQLEIDNLSDKFHLLKERIEFAESQLVEKEKRFAEQTEVVRELNRQLLESTLGNGKLSAQIAELMAERKMKLCERKGCKERQPQSGY